MAFSSTLTTVFWKRCRIVHSSLPSAPVGVRIAMRLLIKCDSGDVTPRLDYKIEDRFSLVNGRSHTCLAYYVGYPPTLSRPPPLLTLHTHRNRIPAKSTLLNPQPLLHFPFLRSSSFLMSSTPTLNLNIEFGGGVELLFGNIRSHKITIPALAPATASGSKPERPSDVTFLIQWLKDNLLKERSELFVDANGEGVCVWSFYTEEERY